MHVDCFSFVLIIVYWWVIHINYLSFRYRGNFNRGSFRGEWRGGRGEFRGGFRGGYRGRFNSRRGTGYFHRGSDYRKCTYVKHCQFEFPVVCFFCLFVFSLFEKRIVKIALYGFGNMPNHFVYLQIRSIVFVSIQEIDITLKFTTSVVWYLVNVYSIFMFHVVKQSFLLLARLISLISCKTLETDF